MPVRIGPRALLAAAALCFQAQSGAAQSQAVQAIRDAALIDVPLELGEIDPSPGAAMLWVKRKKPANVLLARFSVRPLQVATMTADGADHAGPLLWRAFAGGGITILRSDELRLTEGPRYFCGEDAGRPALSCFIDEDGDGRFDRVAEAVTERGSKPYHITLIKAARPLDAPRAYRILPDAERPALPIELRNCQKDYDRPRYAVVSTSDRAVPLRPAALDWHDKDSSFNACRRGSRLPPPSDSAVAIPKGGYLARMGPLLFTVGPKTQARLALIGPAEPSALYRLEGASLVAIRIGHTPGQARLLAAKAFPYPRLMADEGATIHDGPLAAGGLLATIPFHHAYRGTLTQDIAITTLLGKRALAAGTVVYGFPAQSRITRTRDGIPYGEAVDDEAYRTVALELTWCAPVRDADPGADKPKAIGRGGWSAACIPHSTLGNYTIITDLQPAFGVSRVAYDVRTSSNDGRPPIARADESRFAQPLRLAYVYEGREGAYVALREQIYFGEELTSSAPKKLYAPSGEVSIILAGAPVALTAGGNGELVVKPAGPALVGADPLLAWDQRALIATQLRKMGLRLVPSGSDTAAGDVGDGATE